MGKSELNPDGVQNLCAAIIKSAVVDYRSALRKMTVSGEIEGTEKQKRKYKAGVYQEIMELREFFHSSWFETLSDLDGPAVQKRVEENFKSELYMKMKEAKKRKEKAEARMCIV